MRPIEYAEYKEVLNVLNRTNVEDSYQDLMKKEENTLKTVNNVIKYYRDKDIQDGEFIYQNINTILTRFLDVWNDILNDLVSAKGVQGYKNAVFKEDRIIYIGISLVIIGFILFLLESSKW